MRAVGFGANRGDDSPNCLIDLDLPEPSPGPMDLLVQVEAVSINPVDAKVRRRETPSPGAWRVLGWDCAGTVLALGDAVSGFAVGDAVWYAGALNRPGCNSERHLVDHRLVGHRPPGWSAAEAAALPLTAAGLGVVSAPASACEKHLDGHQNGSETQAEVQGERR